MTEDGQKYKEFKDMHGKEPDESACPSLKPGSLIDKTFSECKIQMHIKLS